MSYYFYCSLTQFTLHSQIFLYPDNFFWFLWALFFISVLFIANQMFSKRIHIDEMLIHLAVCCVLSGIMVLLNLRLFGFQFIAYYFLFYLLGYTIRRYDLTRYVNGMAAATLFLIWGVLAWFWNMHELPLGLKEIFCYPETIMLFIYRIITAFIAIIILLKVCPLLMSNSNSMVLSILVSFGKLSLGIYTTHLLFADIIKDNDIVLPNVIISEVLLSFLLVLASYGLVRLISSNTILSRWMLGKV